MVNNSLYTEMLVTYNSILIITALLLNLNATAPKNPGWKLEQRCSICADTVFTNVWRQKVVRTPPHMYDDSLVK